MQSGKKASNYVHLYTSGGASSRGDARGMSQRTGGWLDLGGGKKGLCRSLHILQHR